MATTAPKDATGDATDASTPPADGTTTTTPADPTPADPPAADDETKDDDAPPADDAPLVASVSGNLITLKGNGFEPGKRYDVRFQRPDGAIDNTVAVAQEDGSLTTYATVRGTGKHLAWLELLGSKVAELKFKV